MNISGHTDLTAARTLIRTRPTDAHKGTMGHAGLIAGSYGMLGAAILAAKACLRSGVGKLTCFTEPSAYPILQVSVPEAIFQIGQREDDVQKLEHKGFQAIAFGPGIGRHPSHDAILQAICSCTCPIVLDADALNHMAKAGPDIWRLIPAGSILTPHRGEFIRLFSANAEPASIAKKYRIYLIFKGPGTLVCTPEGDSYVNQSGNAGLATAGSGDVLTGILLGLLARGYPLEDGCRLGVFLHGLAGDLAIESIGPESLIASDLINYLPAAFLRVADTH